MALGGEEEPRSWRLECVAPSKMDSTTAASDSDALGSLVAAAPRASASGAPGKMSERLGGASLRSREPESEEPSQITHGSSRAAVERARCASRAKEEEEPAHKLDSERIQTRRHLTWGGSIEEGGASGGSGCADALRGRGGGGASQNEGEPLCAKSSTTAGRASEAAHPPPISGSMSPYPTSRPPSIPPPGEGQATR